MTRTIAEQLTDWIVEEPVGDGTFRKVPLMAYVERHTEEAVRAALASPSLDVERWNAAMDRAMQAVAELQPYGLSPEETPLLRRSDVLLALLSNRLTTQHPGYWSECPTCRPDKDGVPLAEQHGATHLPAALTTEER